MDTLWGVLADSILGKLRHFPSPALCLRFIVLVFSLFTVYCPSLTSRLSIVSSIYMSVCLHIAYRTVLSQYAASSPVLQLPNAKGEISVSARHMSDATLFLDKNAF